MSETQRIFRAIDRNGHEQEFELIPPTAAIENEGERQYRVAFSEALRTGIFPREKMREMMREHAMWTEEDERAMKIEVGKIAILQVELQNEQASGNDDACIRIAKEISDARRRMWELFLVQQTVYMNSAEGFAETIKTEAMMAACTQVKASKKRYWENYSEYVRERDLNEKSTVYACVVEVQSNILDDVRQGLMDDYPEKQYLKDAQERMIDREVEEEVTRQLKVRADRALAKDEATPQKKTTRKKKTTKKVVAKRGKKPVGTKTDQAS
jgi:hypothetical protein